VTGVNAAIDQVAREIGRTWRNVPVDAATLGGKLASVDALVLYAQGAVTAYELDALAAAWHAPLATFLGRGGAVIVLEGTSGATHRLVGDWFPSTGRTTTTGSALTVSAPRDALAAAVPSEYWAEVDSVAFTGTTAPVVVVDAASDPVVLHQTY